MISSGAVAINFTVSLIEGDSHCFAISATIVTGQSPKIAAAFIIGDSDHFRLTDFSLLFKTSSQNFQYGGSANDCSRFSRLGYWPPKYHNVTGRSTICNLMTSEGSASWNLSQEVTELCIYRTGCGSSTPESVAYFSGTLVVSGFDTSTSTYYANSSDTTSPCAIRYDVLTEKILGNNVN